MANYDPHETRLEFMDWWKLLNAELAVRGEPQEGFSAARAFYEESELAYYAEHVAERLARDAAQAREVARARLTRRA